MIKLPDLNKALTQSDLSRLVEPVISRLGFNDDSLSWASLADDLDTDDARIGRKEFIAFLRNAETAWHNLDN